MALRNLLTKTRIPGAGALRLPSSPVVSPAAGSRPLATSSSSNSREGAIKTYLCLRDNYVTLERVLASSSADIKWGGRAVKLLRWTYRLSVICIGGVVLQRAADKVL